MFLALLGALPAAHGELGRARGQADAPAPVRGTVLGASNRVGFCARWSDDTEAVWGVREEFHSVVGSWIFAPIIG